MKTYFKSCLFVVILIFPHISFAVNKWEMISVVTTVLYKYQCNKHIKGFKERTQKEYEIWRKGYADIINSYEKSSNYSRSIIRINSKELSEKEKSELISACKNFEAQLATINEKPDTRLATPQSTWELYMASLKKGDKKTALSCLSGVARRNWGKTFRNISSETMRKLFNSINKFQLSHEISDNIAIGFAINKKGRAGEITFTKSRAGWRISQM